MADNYLEKKFDEMRQGRNSSHKTLKGSSVKSLDSLLLKNRSYRGYDPNYIVSVDELYEIVKVNTRVPSGCNQQLLRFKLVTKGSGDDIVLQNIKLGRALAELNLPLKGTEPNAFIIICSIAKENRLIDIDMGIAAQSMLLKAVDLGLSGICICAFNKEAIKEEFHLEYDPLMILAIGKGIEKIQLLSIASSDDHNYFRKDGIHFVPKVQADDLIL